MPARVLVAYATKLGSTSEIAETIAHVLRDSGHRALALPARDVTTLAGWDAVILGSAVYAAYWQRDARRFTERFRDDLKARPLWLFSGGPLDRRLGQGRPAHHAPRRRDHGRVSARVPIAPSGAG